MDWQMSFFEIAEQSDMPAQPIGSCGSAHDICKALFPIQRIIFTSEMAGNIYASELWKSEFKHAI